MWLQIINFLCKDRLHSSSPEKLRDLLERKNVSVDDLLKYRQERTGDTLMNYACREGNLALLQSLLQLVAASMDPSMLVYFRAANADGKNALHDACQFGHFECVKFLVEKVELPVNALRKGDWTPLMLACTGSNLSIIKYLIEHGGAADLTQKNKDGWTAFHIATREGHLDVISYLAELNPELVTMRTRNGRTPLHTICLHGHLDALEWLLMTQLESSIQRRVVLNAQDSCGLTPFMDAVLGDQLKIVNFLLQMNKNDEKLIDIQQRDQVGNSCLHLAAQAGALECLKYLFSIFYYNVNNQTPVTVAKFNENLNRFGMTPLHSACKNRKSNIIQYFLDEFRLLNDVEMLIQMRDTNNHTPVDICLASNDKDCISILNKFKKTN